MPAAKLRLFYVKLLLLHVGEAELAIGLDDELLSLRNREDEAEDEIVRVLIVGVRLTFV
jgi:hypothetical protein